jgi:hypothetical protein
MNWDEAHLLGDLEAQEARMRNTTHEAPERIWIAEDEIGNPWWTHERNEDMDEYVRADLVQAAEQRGYANAMEAERKLHEARIEALTKERDEAREAWKLEAASLKRFAERHERHLILGAETRTRAERAEAKLAMAVEAGHALNDALREKERGKYLTTAQVLAAEKARATLAAITETPHD